MKMLQKCVDGKLQSDSIKAHLMEMCRPLITLLDGFLKGIMVHTKCTF